MLLFCILYSAADHNTIIDSINHDDYSQTISWISHATFDVETVK